MTITDLIPYHPKSLYTDLVIEDETIFRSQLTNIFTNFLTTTEFLAASSNPNVGNGLYLDTLVNTIKQGGALEENTEIDLVTFAYSLKNGANPIFYVEPTKVGIGTPTPDARLTVVGTTTSSDKIFKVVDGYGTNHISTSVGGFIQISQQYGPNVNIGPAPTAPIAQLEFQRDATQNGQYLGFTNLQTGANKRYWLGISSIDNRFRFYDDTAGVERFVITDTGNVGIANWASDTRFYVRGTTTATDYTAKFSDGYGDEIFKVKNDGSLYGINDGLVYDGIAGLTLANTSSAVANTAFNIKSFSTYSPQINYFVGATAYWGIGVSGSASSFVNGSVLGDLCFRNFSGGTSILFSNSALGTVSGMAIKGNKVYIGQFSVAVTPTAFLDIAASATGQSSLRIRNGVNPTTGFNDGDISYYGSRLHHYTGSTDNTIAYISDFATGFIKGSLPATANLIPFSSGVADTLTSTSTFMSDGTQISIGAVIGGYSTTVGKYNSRSAGGGIDRIFVGEGFGGSTSPTLELRATAGYVSRFTCYGNFGTNYSGTTLSRNGTTHIDAGNTGLTSTATGILVTTSSIFVNITNVTSTNIGNRLDSVGLRIDTNANLHTTNLNAFTVNGNTYLGGNAVATAYLQLRAGSLLAGTAPLKLTCASAVLNSSAEQGAVEVDSNGQIFYSPANNDRRGLRYREPLFSSASNPASITPTSAIDSYDVIAANQPVTVNNSTGVLANFQMLTIRFTSASTIQSITWDTQYISGGANLPSVVNAGKILKVGLQYNTNISKYECIAVVES